MGDLIKRKIRWNSIIIVLLLTGLLGFVYAFCYRYEKSKLDENHARIEINSLLYDLEQKSFGEGAKDQEGKDNQTTKIEFSLDYSVFELDGTVIESTISQYPVGKTMDLHRIGMKKSYLVPIQTKTGTKIVLVDCTHFEQELVFRRTLYLMILPILLYLCAVIVLLRRYKFEKKEVLDPIEELHDSTKSILQGNMQVPVIYDYDGEIGTLCHDFELMREELVDSFDREQQSKDKERALYASISHDLKTPLATITGYIEEILYGVVQSPDEINEYAERMLNKAVVLNKLIDDILDHAKSQLNQLSIQKREVYAREFFEPLLQGYQTDVLRRNCGLSYDLPENVLILMDPYRITQVIQNLIDNAIKYGHEKTKINISFSFIQEPTQQLIVQVQDDGRGIEAADLPFIFDMFYRGNKARTCDIPGSGLGLNIAKYVVEQHGGQIECDSIAGVGTTMSFSLPTL